MRVDTKNTTISSTMVGSTTAMGIRDEDMSHIMGVLADLYKNRPLALLREYGANALDAHVEAGVSLPIEITLPSALQPSLIIRDYGVGLSAEGIRTVYSQYGRSTKRDSNDVVGMLGLGSKSALSYGDQFTVISVKDGLRVSVLIQRNEDGSGSAMILGAPEGEPTDEANGTAVHIAIRREDHQVIAREAADFFKYWVKGTVLVNGQQPVRFEGLRISDNMYIVDGAEDHRIIMGNVAYPVELNLLTAGQRYGNRFSLVCRVPIGDVIPTPSRESLRDVPTTKATIARIEAAFKANVVGALQREIDAAPSPAEAIATVSKWAMYLDPSYRTLSKYTYKGVRLPDEHSGPMKVSRFNNYYKGESSNALSFAAHQWAKTVWVEGFTLAKFNASHKNKLLAWCGSKDLDDTKVVYFVMVEGKAPTSIFIDRSMVVDWDTIKAIKLPKTGVPLNGGRISGSYDLFTEDGYKREVLGSDIRQSHPIYYANGNRWACEDYNTGVKGILGHTKYTLVCLPANRVGKFARDVPAAKEVGKALRDKFDVWAAALTPEVREAIYMAERRLTQRYSCMDATKVKDPALKRAIQVSKTDLSGVNAKLRTFRNAVGSTVDVASTAANPLQKYPLYHGPYDGGLLPHVYLYLNAAYAKESA